MAVYVKETVVERKKVEQRYDCVRKMAWVKMSGLLTFRPAIMSDNEQYGPYKDPEGKSFSRAFP